MLTLQDFSPRKGFLFCVDSDGCVFDTMEIKHKECFCPAFIDCFSLQAVSRYAREAWEFVNLYSDTRGIHRFPALVRALDLVAGRREAQERGFMPAPYEALRQWAASTPKLSDEALLAACGQDPDHSLQRAYEWSLEVNRRVDALVHGVPPFPGVWECLEHMRRFADVVIVSGTPEAAIRREWAEHRIDQFAGTACGQETGTKPAILAALVGRYPAGHVIMIGDAPGDRKAAHANGALFYPICPGDEAQSWKELFPLLQDMEAGRYGPSEEAAFSIRFDRLLPSTPPWQTA